MADIQLPNNATKGGMIDQWNQKILAAPEGLITGDQPALGTMDRVFAADQQIPAWTPVEEGPDGLVPGSGDPTKAAGITIVDVDTTGGPRGAPVYESGCFNPDLINWPAAYDTDAKKMAAFRGAPTPVTIIMRRRKTATVTLP